MCYSVARRNQETYMAKPVTLAQWPSKAANTAPAPAHTSPITDWPNPLEEAEIQAILAVFERIDVVWPLRRNSIMRAAFDRGTTQFSWFFDATKRRIKYSDWDKLVQLFGCESREAFLALDPNTTPGLAAIIDAKGLSQHVWKKQA